MLAATMAHTKSPVRAEAIPTPMAWKAFFKVGCIFSRQKKWKKLIEMRPLHHREFLRRRQGRQGDNITREEFQGTGIRTSLFEDCEYEVRSVYLQNHANGLGSKFFGPRTPRFPSKKLAVSGDKDIK